MNDILKHYALEFYYLYPRDKDKAMGVYNTYLQNNLLFLKIIEILKAEGELKNKPRIGVINNRTIEETKREKSYEKYVITKPVGELAYLTDKYLKNIIPNTCDKIMFRFQKNQIEINERDLADELNIDITIVDRSVRILGADDWLILINIASSEYPYMVRLNKKKFWTKKDSYELKTQESPTEKKRAVIVPLRQDVEIYSNSQSEQLFLRTISDLRERLTGDGYDYIRACHLIRQLLLDGANSLSIVANKNHRIKIIYKVRKQNPSKPEIAWYCLTPLEHEGGYFDELKLQEFLKVTVCIYHEHTYTVKDIILYGAHIMGGVHGGMPSDEKEKVYLQIQNKLPLMGNRLYAISLFSIIEVVLEALKPLENLIQGHTPTGGF